MSSAMSELGREESILKSLDAYIRLSSGEQDDFQRIVNKLISCTFITKKKQDLRRDYYFIEQNEALFTTFLQMAGWRLLGDKRLGVYQAMSLSRQNKQDLNMDQSIILLIVRLCYEEKLKDISFSDDVIIRTDEIQEKYAALKIRERPIDKQSMREAITLFKRFNLLDNIDRSILDPECRFIVYPSILMAVRVDDINSVYNKLKTYSKNSSLSEEDPDNVGDGEQIQREGAGDDL